MDRDAWIGLVALAVIVYLGYQGLQLVGILDEEGEAFERTCEEYGGHVTQTDVTCEITYNGESYTIPIENINDTFDEEEARSNRQHCLDGQRNERRSQRGVARNDTYASDRYVYHEDTGVCEVEIGASIKHGTARPIRLPKVKKPSGGSGGHDCAEGYTPCVPPYPPDVNCDDVGPVIVTGDDPHLLDGDGDGRACGGD